jgi:carbon storage regulator
MLVLTRKQKESIIIDNQIELTILEIKGDHVRIGINAPSSVKIYRSEVWESIKNANISSKGVSDQKLEEISMKFHKKKSKE